MNAAAGLRHSRGPSQIVTDKFRSPSSNKAFMFFRLAKLFNQFLHLLRLALVREEHGVVGLDENRIAQSYHRNGCAPVLGAHVEDDVTRPIHVNEISHRAIPFRVGFEMPAEGGPRAEIV